MRVSRGELLHGAARRHQGAAPPGGRGARSAPPRTSRSSAPEPPPPSEHIKALKERESEFEITFPNVVGYRIEYGEKEYDNPMPWDEISKADYMPFENINYMTVVKNSQKRVKASPQFALIEQQAQEVKVKKDDTRYSLKLDSFRAEQKQIREQNKKYEDLNKNREQK